MTSSGKPNEEIQSTDSDQQEESAVEDAVVTEEIPPGENTAETASQGAAVADDDHPDADVASEPSESAPKAVSSFPLIVAGVATAAIGFAAGFILRGDSTETLQLEINTLSSALEQERARISEIEPRLSDIGRQISAVEAESSSLADEIDASDANLTNVSRRIAELQAEFQTMSETVASGALDTNNLDAQAEQFRAELSQIVEDARAELLAAQEEAAGLEEQLAQDIQSQDQRVALERIAQALNDGSSFADHLSVLRNLAIPPALVDLSETGVPSLLDLREAFPDAARAALSSAIRSDVDGTTRDRILAFLRAQTGARSLEPREGDDPDAILSRAEAALGDSDIAQALAEIENLPDIGKEKMAEWVDMAQSRLEALAALADLQSSVTN